MDIQSVEIIRLKIVYDIQLSLWSAMLVMFLVEVLLPIPFSFAILSSILIGLIYLVIEAFACFGKQ